ncbi:MAG: hypothetical protein ABI172_03290 [Ginsengibacter sp.]
MQQPNTPKPVSKRFIYIIAAALIVCVAGYFVWQHYKYKIANKTINTTIAKKTDNLYTIKYDSLLFDEISGNASIRNIQITPDTARVKKMSVEDQPDILLDIKIKSITIAGLKTAKALAANEMTGDSVIINQPVVILYSLKPLKKGTKIETEAGNIYKQILGKLDLIKVKFVLLNKISAKGVDFYSKEKNFDFINGNILLQDVLIDSTHHLDTSRTLFCKQADFTVDSFFSYNNTRKEFSVKDISFSGIHRTLFFSEISIDRFADSTGNGIRLLDASSLQLTGVNTNEIVKNKNLDVDTVLCKNITLYQAPVEKSKSAKKGKMPASDSSGFMKVYSVNLNHLQFDKVSFVPFAKSNYSVGNISLKINGVKADRIVDLELHPMKYSKEVEVAVSKFSINSKDKMYHFYFSGIVLNSLQKQLKISTFSINPFLSEAKFADKAHFQKDRYDIKMGGISLRGITMEDLLDNKIVASELVVNSVTTKIYHDLTKPIEKKSKIGNYPSQILKKINLPINISKATLENAYIEYKEREKISDSTGVVNFSNSKLILTNITNIPSAIKANNALNISFETKALNAISLKGNFKFLLNSDEGNFYANASVAAFDAKLLNQISVPMALIKVNTGKINSIDFHFTGNNTSAEGDFEMQYENLKVDVLKRDKKNNNRIKKKGLLSLVANIIVKNSNPGKGNLRKVKPSFDRDIYKSFFNLLWKMIFTGMKETVGLP